MWQLRGAKQEWLLNVSHKPMALVIHKKFPIWKIWIQSELYYPLLPITSGTYNNLMWKFIFIWRANEEIYMEIPPGYRKNIVINSVCKLQKELYGLKRSSWVRFGRFTKAMTALGYKKIMEIIQCLLSILLQGEL